MKIKITTGFRKDQSFSVPAEEAHKAYYLFFNPDARTVFSTGLALKGSDIQHIEPDWQGTMDWNPAHVLDTDDWNDIRRSGVQSDMRIMLERAQAVAKIGDPKDLALSLSEALNHHPKISMPKVERQEGMKRIGEM